MNVGAGRKKDCLKKLAAIPILLRSADGISKIGWSVNGMRMKQERLGCYIGRKMGGTSMLAVTQVIDDKVDSF